MICPESGGASGDVLKNFLRLMSGSELAASIYGENHRSDEMSIAPKPAPSALSREGFLRALAALAEADLAWLVTKGERFAWAISGWSGDDLLQAAIARTIRGTRTCPADLRIIVHLTRTMQSIAFRERAKAYEAEAAWAEIESERAHEDPQTRLEHDEAERTLRARVSDAFAHHPNARSVALGTLDGLQGAQLRAFTGLDQRAYEAARKAMNRELDRHLRRARHD